MSGSANKEDCGQLQLGGSCIIEVDRVNNPKGLWWGTVDSIEQHETHVVVRARITGGRFSMGYYLIPREVPIKSDEEQGREPSVNYTVYPDTQTTRRLFERILLEEARCDSLRGALAQVKTTYADLIAAVVKVLMPGNVDMAALTAAIDTGLKGKDAKA